MSKAIFGAQVCRSMALRLVNHVVSFYSSVINRLADSPLTAALGGVLSCHTCEFCHWENLRDMASNILIPMKCQNRL